jgi:hypothetical protein
MCSMTRYSPMRDAVSSELHFANGVGSVMSCDGSAAIPDEDPDLEPTVHIHSNDEHGIPYEVVCRSMEHVAEQVERCRLAFEQEEPEAVE